MRIALVSIIIVFIAFWGVVQENKTTLSEEFSTTHAHNTKWKQSSSHLFIDDVFLKKLI